MKFSLVFLLVCCTVFTSAKSIGGEPTCMEIIENELELIPGGVLDNIKNCFDGLVKAVLNLGEDLIGSTNSAIVNALKLKKLILECKNAGGSLRKFACLAKNVGELKNTILQVISDAEELITVLQDRGVELVDAVTSCHIHDFQTMFYIEIIAAQVQQCPDF